MIGSLLKERYRIEAELGKGGMGTVYRAYDTLLERAVAVKVLSASGIGTEGRSRLLHEARAAAQLNHPNIVSIFDAGEAEGVSFIVMELLEGESLFDYKPHSLEDILQVVRQVCRALEHAHARGIVHRDLKPENVIITADGKIKLTDFGLAHSISSRISTEGSFIGTIYYMAPEQVLGKPVDERTDLYALGAMLYELTTGRLPFIADDSLAVISQHLYAPVAPPSTYTPDLPAALDRLIVRLLSKQPEDRPASAEEVRRALDPEQLNLSITSLRPATIGLLACGRSIGRERELVEARALWRRASEGKTDTPVLLISGESGIGKTPLVREIKAFAEVTQAIVLSSACYAEGSAPYAPVADLFRGALPHLWNGGAQPVLPDAALVDLAALTPELSLQLAQPREGLPAGPGAPPPASAPYFPMPLAGIDPCGIPLVDQARLFESAVSLVSALAVKSPVMLVVEDGQWADSGSLSLLRHLARRARSVHLRLLILLTYREAEMDKIGCLEDILLDFNRERLAARIKLTRYDRQQTRQVLSVMFQDEVSPAFADAIYRETEGNLFFIEEICKVLVEQGKISRQGGRWHITGMEGVPLPQSVRLAIQARVGKQPEVVQQVLRVAAIIGREFEFAVLQQSGDFDEHGLIEALEMAEQAQLIAEARPPGQGREGEERFTFAHALISTALSESVSGLRRHRLHRRVANAIEKLHPDDYEALAYHYHQANDAIQACTFYARAADRAMSLYASQAAERAYRAALDLFDLGEPGRAAEAQAGAASSSPQLPGRIHLINQLGEALFRQNRYPEAIHFWQQGIELASAQKEFDRLAHLYARAARAAWYNGDPKFSLVLCLQGMALMSPDFESPGMAELLHETARAFRFRDILDEVLPLCQKALAMAKKLGLAEVQAESLATLGILPTQPPEVRRQALLEAIAIAEGAGLLASAARAHFNLGGFLRDAAELEVSRKHILRARELAHRIGAVGWEHDFTASAVGLALDIGDVVSAEKLIAEMRHLHELMPDPANPAAYTAMLQANLLAARFELAEALALYSQSKAEIVRFADARLMGELALNLGNVYLELGDLPAAEAAAAETAVQEAEQVANQGSEHPTWMVHYYIFAARLALKQGRFDAARLHLERARLFQAQRLNQSQDKPFLGRMLEFVDACLAAAEGHWMEAFGAFDAVQSWAQKSGFLWRQAYVLEAWAEALRQRALPGDADAAAALDRQARQVWLQLHIPARVKHIDQKLGG